MWSWTNNLVYGWSKTFTYCAPQSRTCRTRFSKLLPTMVESRRENDLCHISSGSEVWQRCLNWRNFDPKFQPAFDTTTLPHQRFTAGLFPLQFPPRVTTIETAYKYLVCVISLETFLHNETSLSAVRPTGTVFQMDQNHLTVSNLQKNRDLINVIRFLRRPWDPRNLVPHISSPVQVQFSAVRSDVLLGLLRDGCCCIQALGRLFGLPRGVLYRVPEQSLVRLSCVHWQRHTWDISSVSATLLVSTSIPHPQLWTKKALWGQMLVLFW